MMHPRRAIREAFRARLIAAGTSAEDRVFNSRLAPIGEKDDLPAILIYSRDEKSDPDKDFGAEGRDSFQTRTLRLITEGIVAGGETVDDKLDDLARQIEAALEEWDIPGFESARCRLIETDIDVVVDSVAFPIGAVGLLWQVRYRTAWRASGDYDPILDGDGPESIP